MTKVKKLTERQKEIFEFIVEYMGEHSYSPSIREIGDKFNIRSTNGVFDHINALVRKGYISREYFQARSITILRNPDGTEFVDPKQGFIGIVGEVEKALKWAKNSKSNVNRQSVVERLNGILNEYGKAA